MVVPEDGGRESMVTVEDGPFFVSPVHHHIDGIVTPPMLDEIRDARGVCADVVVVTTVDRAFFECPAENEAFDFFSSEDRVPTPNAMFER